MNSAFVFAQKAKTIVIENSDFSDINQFEVPDAVLLTGNVRLSHDGATMTCNKAYYYQKENYIKAFGDVQMVQGDTLYLNSKYAEYNGNIKKAFAAGNVVMTSPESTMTTDTIHFNRNTQEAYFNSNGTIVNKNNTLKSKAGRYYLKEKKYQFLSAVELKNPEYTIKTNHLDYKTTQGNSDLKGPSTIVSKETFIYTENGHYNSKNNTGHFLQKSYIKYKDRLIEGDSLYYDRKIEYASGTNNVKITDSINKAIIKGHYGEVFKQKDSVYITKHASIRYKVENDSMFVHAKKIFLTGKTGERIVRGQKNVRFFKTDLSGKCDSIHSDQKRGLTQLINKPILWNFENQLTGDVMHLIGNNKTEKLDSLKVLNNTFIISKDTIGEGFNQIKGLNLYGKFLENKLHEVDVIKNTEVVYYMRNDKNELIGINKNVSSKINMIMDDKSKVETITFFNNVDGDIYPEKDLPENARKLRGFVWRGDERIKTKEDIFPEDEVELDKKIVEESREKYKKESSNVNEILSKESEELAKYKVLDYVLDANFQPKNSNTNVKIVLDVVAPMDDKFQIFYKQDGTNNFNEEESEKAIIKGSSTSQLISFYVPNNVKITNLRIDPGENPNQGEIKINSIEIIKNEKKIKIQNKELLDFFALVNDLKFNTSKRTINHISLKKNGIIDPILINNENLIKQLKRIF
jgi:lipopolysaccharide export system protein LptA